MPFTIEFPNLQAIRDKIKQVPDRLKDKARPIFLGAGAKLQKTMVTRTSGDPLKRRTGQLARSWQIDTTQNPLLPISVTVKSQGVPYAHIQETGGTIRPTNAQYLTIPVGENLTPAGVMRQSAAQAISAGAFFVTSKQGNLLIAQKGAGKGDLVPLFVLKKEITLPARLGFEDSAKLVGAELYQNLNKLVEKSV